MNFSRLVTLLYQMLLVSKQNSSRLHTNGTRYSNVTGGQNVRVLLITIEESVKIPRHWMSKLKIEKSTSDVSNLHQIKNTLH